MATNGTESEAGQRSTTPTLNGTAHSKGEVSPPPYLNGKVNGQQDEKSDSENEMVIHSLRVQNQDLYTQVQDLNSKLVQSYERVSDLEHNLELSSTSQSQLLSKVTQLETLQSQHAKLVDSGELVERWQVKNELTGLMERATEEAAQRGEAESARTEIERELEELSASLFGQANRMVVEARVRREESERRLEEAERALKGAEEAMRGMQNEMQALIEEKAKEKEPTNAIVQVGKWMYDHVPYVEYLAFLAHLRQLHILTPKSVPAMSTLLQLPFLARLSVEDSDPTLRLDFAPSLNWLTRRSVQAAIYSGQLSVEPLTMSNSLSMLPEQCALCGAKSQASTVATIPVQIYVFKLPASSNAPTTTTAFVSSATNININIPYYALCSSGWCLARLRTTCSLWSFIRTGIVDKIWDEPLPPPVPPPIHPSLSASSTTSTSSNSSANTTQSSSSSTKSKPSTIAGLTPPTIPPRRRTLWGIATALGERAVSWSDEKGKKLVSGVNGNMNNNVGIGKRIISSSASASSSGATVSTPSPPFPPKSSPKLKTESRSTTPTPVPGSFASNQTRTPTSSPPPLPKRSGNRSMGAGRVGSPAPASPSSSSVGAGAGIVSTESEKEIGGDTPKVASTSTGEGLNGLHASSPTLNQNSDTTATNTEKQNVDMTRSSAADTPSDPAPTSNHNDNPNPNPTPPHTPPLRRNSHTTVPNPGSRTSTPTPAPTSSVPPPIPRRAAARRKGDGGEKKTEEKEKEGKSGPEPKDEPAAKPAEKERSEPTSAVKDGVGKRVSGGALGLTPAASTVAVSDDTAKAASKEEDGEAKVELEPSNVDPNGLLFEASVEETEHERRKGEEDSGSKPKDLGGGGSEKAPTVEGEEPNEVGDVVNGVEAKPEEPEPTTEEETKPSSSEPESKLEPKHQRVSESSTRSQLPEPQCQNWESKTWVELVRLREDMFWARVGRLSGLPSGG